MLRPVVILALLTATACLAVDRLYLKDGDYQLVREYQVQGDRVRYYSTERSDWEEIPLELVDLERTRKEKRAQEEIASADAKEEAEERTAVKAQHKLVASVPDAAGAYLLRDDKVEALKIAEGKLVSDKKRTILKFITGVPILPGKSTIELDGEHAATRLENMRPEFFFRMSNYERYDIVRLAPKKGARVAMKLSIIAIQGEQLVEQEIDKVEVFRKQEGDLLYRIWPQKSLEPGEYAILQYTEGKVDGVQLWDFAIGK